MIVPSGIFLSTASFGVSCAMKMPPPGRELSFRNTRLASGAFTVTPPVGLSAGGSVFWFGVCASSYNSEIISAVCARKVDLVQ